MTVADSDGRLLLRTVLTCYPGGGSRYIRHIDNPNRNGRLLTAIYYLNLEWTEADGGTLRIFPPALTGAASATAAQPEPEPEPELELELHPRSRSDRMGWRGAVGLLSPVSHFCACIGSPCLRQRVHGASI